jgi:hypothetical protein
MHSRIVQLARALAGRRPTIFNKRLQRRGASICPISVFAATQRGNSIHCFSLAIGQFALDSATFTGYIERTISFAANVACTKPASFLDVTRTRRITKNGDQVEHLILQAIANGRLIEFLLPESSAHCRTAYIRRYKRSPANSRLSDGRAK